MRAILTILSGPEQGKVLSIEPGNMLRFGRKSSAEVSIPEDRAMSGLHFAILMDKSRCRIRDLNSTNGTFVNGIRANLVELFDRDAIKAGNSEFEIRFEGSINSTIVDPLLYPEIDKIRKGAKPQPVSGEQNYDSTCHISEVTFDEDGVASAQPDGEPDRAVSAP